ncbi:MAG: adenosine kinase [Pseudomonadota bacterium]
MTKQAEVVTIGNAIVDVLAHTDDAFLTDNQLVKGSMNLIDATEAETLYAKMGPAIEISGGSAANTAAGIASLGVSAGYIGKVCDDQLGQVFRHDIEAAGVTFISTPIVDEPPTARSFILVTPDAQRTMNTYLGACVLLTTDDIDRSLIAGADVTYMEGYLWDRPTAQEAYLLAAKVAHEAERKVSLTLSDTFCVERHRDSFAELVSGHVDILFANEAEAKTLYQTEDLDQAVERARADCEIAAITRSEKGALILNGPSTFEISAERHGDVIDTTGAGDLFAAGFLAGFVEGRHLADCGKMGAIAAAEIISHIGARPKADLKSLIADRI